MTGADCLPVVRRAELPDAAALAELAERTFRQTFSHSTTPENVDLHCRRSYGAAIQAREIADPALVTLVSPADGALVGYAQLRFGGESPPLAGPAAELQRIYVDAAWHGRGVAAELLAAGLAHAAEAGAEQLWLGVWENNHRGIAFYRKHGFVEVGEQIFPVGDDPQRDLVLCRPVTAVDR